MDMAISSWGLFPLTSSADKTSETRECGGLSIRMIWGVTFAVSLLLMLASACGGTSANLEERVTAYWQARLQKQAEKAFEFEAPGSVEKSLYLQQVLASPISFTGSSIMSIDEKGDEATVNLRMQYLLPGLTRSVTSSTMERWVKLRGQWYRQSLEQEKGTSAVNTERR